MWVESTVKAASVSKRKANVRKRRQQFRNAQVHYHDNRRETDSEAREVERAEEKKGGG